jgi:hypothetical protein
MTRLSWSSPKPVHNGWCSGLARLSLAVASLALLPSCLVDDPPAYSPPKRTPPRLDYHFASPSLDRLIVAKEPDTLLFRIPVASEDAGEGLVAHFFYDDTFLNYQSLPASTLEDRERYAKFAYPVLKENLGCHRFKMRISHASNLPSGTEPALDPQDVAEVYWWVNLNVAPEDAGTLNDCPTFPWTP